MIVTAWNYGQHHSTGAWYVIMQEPADRDRHFQCGWQSVMLELVSGEKQVEVNIAKPSFWVDTCRELTSAEIGRWLIQNGLAPWLKCNPLKLILEPLGEKCFRL